MLRNVLFLSLLFLISGLKAQQVVATMGYFAENQQVSLSWTIGETFVTTLSSENNHLTQGFNQSKLSLTIVFEKKTDPGLKIYPNPVQESLFIEANENAGELHYDVISPEGKSLATSGFTGTKADISFKPYASGVYFLHIFSNEELLKIVKIVKK
ncbi:MAG: T9SS type A sorting domain-containing protein [Bacteroidales bacterium]